MPASSAEVQEALTAGRDELAEAIGRPLTVFAYPHGGTDEQIADAARQAGFLAAFTTDPRPVGATDDPLLLGRIEAPFASARDMAMLLRRALAPAGAG